MLILDAYRTFIISLTAAMRQYSSRDRNKSQIHAHHEDVHASLEGGSVSRIHVHKFFSASVLSVHLYILLGICVYNGSRWAGEEERDRERKGEEKRCRGQQS